MEKRPIAQIEYFVRDVTAAVTRHSATFGSGPFRKEDDVPLSNCDYRGRPIELGTTAAFGYWGPIVVQFVQQNTQEPSVFTERRDREGLHSVALMAEDVEAEVARLGAAGLQLALTADVGVYGNFKLLYVDALERYGHFIKVLPKTDAVTQAFARLRGAADEFAGGDPWLRGR